MRLNTESKIPRLSASALQFSLGGWAGILPIIIIEKVKTEPEEVEVKEFKEDKKALVPSRLRLDHSMLYCPH